MGQFGRTLGISAALLLAALPASAYYHYVHYLSGSLTPVPEAFDLTALPNKTVTFFVSDAGLAAYGSNDSFGSVLSEVKNAAAVWNSVACSDLRVWFGGLETYNANQISATPGGDVVFEELAPGILGYGAPSLSSAATVQTGQNGQFIPISRGLVILTNSTATNYTVPVTGYGPGPSYLEEFYTTAVHEFGHALGLQHTWTAAAMSQAVIRNTSRARPIDADDIAAIAELYGTAGWTAGTGSISGVVSANGHPWTMASVVAIPPQGPAVSALTNPDGSYTINGLTPGQYLLYAHPLPPDAVQPSTNDGLALPVGANGTVYKPTAGYFQTVFYPGTTDVTQAQTFTVTAGQALTGENFTVQARSQIPVYDIQTDAYLDLVQRTYSYSQTDPTAFVSPAYASTNQQYLEMLVQPNNSNSMPLPATATLLGPGTGAAAEIASYQGWAVLYFPNNGGLVPGPHHLVMTFSTSQGTDMFVVPDAINIVQNGPPSIPSLTQNPDGSVTVTAAGLTPGSRIFFDGLQAAVTVPFAATDTTDGTVTVMPPPGASGQTSTVVVYTADNQNSMLVQSSNPVTYSYPVANAPQITSVYPPGLPAGFNLDGTAAMVEITAANTNFVQGQVTVGFGTSDISVRRVWVLDATHLIADVVVQNNAVIEAWPVSVISGFQVAEQPAAFQVIPANTSLPTPTLPVFNAVSYATVLHDSDYCTIFGSNLVAGPASPQVLLDGVAAPVAYASSSQINFQVPAGFPLGGASLQIDNGYVSAFPVFLQIDSAPAVIGAVTNAAGAAVQTVNPGDIVNVQVTNVPASIANNPGSVSVTLSGVPMSVQSVTSAGGGAFQIQFAVTQSFGGWPVPLVVSVNGSPSMAAQVTAK
jgi:uncharacterized protein (TIGR03437 family)